jgi:hypothetical protein
VLYRSGPDNDIVNFDPTPYKYNQRIWPVTHCLELLCRFSDANDLGLEISMDRLESMKSEREQKGSKIPSKQVLSEDLSPLEEARAVLNYYDSLKHD